MLVGEKIVIDSVDTTLDRWESMNAVVEFTFHPALAVPSVLGARDEAEIMAVGFNVSDVSAQVGEWDRSK
jgi:hypothetical protein